MARQTKLLIEVLESRWNPGNLQITNLQLVNGLNNTISETPLGETVYLRATWSATGLTVGEQYVVRFTLDGVDYDSGVITHSSDGVKTWYRGTWFARAGSHTVSAKIDGANQISESNEGDNTQSFNLIAGSIVGPDTKWLFPIDAKPTRLYWTNNYGDVDPTSGQADYLGGEFQYDGHDGHDIGPGNFSFQDAGVPLIAVAPGVVAQVNDGNFDRETSSNSRPWNGVTIDHQNGWKTVYGHMAANSITVKVGDTVAAGQLLGLMGSSGSSTGTHIHFNVLHNNAVVEPMYDASKFFLDPPPYQGVEDPKVLAAGTSNYDFWNNATVPDGSEGVSSVTQFPTSVPTNDLVYTWFNITNYPAGSAVAVKYYRPNGTFAFQFDSTPSKLRAGSRYWSAYTGNFLSNPGNWEVVLTINGVEKGRTHFTITTGSGEPEIVVSESTRTVLDERTTPLDFGSVASGGTAPTKTFTITNRGYTTLNLSNLVLPQGFSLVGSFPSSLAANATHDSTTTFVIRMDTAVVGEKYGVLKFDTNDTDEPIYNFLLKGIVTGTTPSGTPALTLPGPAATGLMGDSARFLDATSTFSDSDHANYNSGSLRYEIIQGGSVNDRLTIAHAGTGSGQIGVSGSNVSYSGTTIGTFSGGTGNTPLVITFNNASTPAAIQSLMRRITYQNVATTYDARPRFIQVTVLDPSSNRSNVGIKRVSLAMDPVNDAPVVNATPVDMVPVLEDTTTPTPQTVGSFAMNGATDADNFDPYGIALTGYTTAQGGTWNYSIDGGGTWKTFGTVSNSAALLLRATDLVRFTPAANANGTATLQYRAWDQSTDLYGAKIDLTATGVTGGKTAFSTGTQTANLAITPVNDVPSFTKGANQTVIEDAGAQTVNNWATAISTGPSNESSQTASFAMTNNTNLGLFSVLPAVSSTGQLTYTPAPNANGSATITLRVTDNGGTSDGGVDASATQSFTITVTAVNDAPSFVKGANQRLIQTPPQPQSISNWATAVSAGPADEAAQTLTFELVANSDPSLFTVQPAVSSNGMLTYTPATNAHGYSTITIRLKDNGGTANSGVDVSSSQSFWIGVNPINAAPSFTAGSNPTVLEDANLTTIPNWATNLNTGSTFESDQLLSFEVLSNTNSGLFSTAPSIDSSGTLQFRPATNQNGSATIQVRIRDNGGTTDGGVDASATQSFTINVTAVNDAPSFTKGSDQNANQGTGQRTVPNWATNLLAGPTDEAAQSLTFEITNNSNPSLFSVLPVVASDGTLTFTPSATNSGAATITLRIKDNGGTANSGLDTSTTQTFVINILPVNAPPSFTKGIDHTSNEDASGQAVANWATNISAGANESFQNVIFEITNNTNSSLFSVAPAVAPNGTLTYTTAENANGTATITLRAKDDGGTANGGVDISSTQTFTITVNAINDVPIFTKGLDQTTVEDAGEQTTANWATTISAGPTDENSQVLQFFVTTDNGALFSVPPAISPTGTLTFTPATNASGSAIVSVRVKDNGGTTSNGVDTSAIQTFVITVNPANDAPLLDNSGTTTFNTLAEDENNNLGMLITSLIASSGGNAVTDIDANAVEGLAVVVADTAHGAWEYTLDGVTWTGLGSVSDTNARLLASDALTRLRFVPAMDFNGLLATALSFRAWDQTSGSNGGTGNANANGGTTAFSTTIETARLTVTPVNDPPRFMKGDSQTVNEDNGEVVEPGWATNISAGPTDENSQTVQFIVSTDNDALFAIRPAISSTGELTYTTAADRFGSATVTVQLKDSEATNNTSDPQTFTITVVSQNDAPTLTASTIALAPIPRNTTSSTGERVDSLLAKVTTNDIDGTIIHGIAIVSQSGQGTWEYSLDDGATWLAFGNPSLTTARLLPSEAVVRFIPTMGTTGTATFIFHAWDESVGTAGSTANLDANTGGISPFSEAFATVSIDVVATLTPFDEDTKKIKGDLIGNVVRDFIIDPDANAKPGVALTTLSGLENGLWQYSLDKGRRWTTITNVANTHALLLRDTDMVRFVPNANFVGHASFTYHAWDQSTGTGGTVADLSTTGATGGATPFSTTTQLVYAIVRPVNDAPVLAPDKRGNFTHIVPNATNPDGDFVKTILGPNATDVDGNSIGIAIINVKGKGEWEYRLTNTSVWQKLGLPTANAARLLTADDQLRFIPTPGTTGSASIAYRAWDGTVGSTGSVFKLGISTAFSKNTTTATLRITNDPPATINTAPVLNNSGFPILANVLEDTKKPAGTPISSVMGPIVDSDVLKGIAITATTGRFGTWQYSLNGKSWLPMNTLSPSSALLLRETDHVRFVPHANQYGTATFTYHAWDNSRGMAGTPANVALGTGGTTPFSNEVETVNLSVTPTNDAPTLSTKLTPYLTPVAPTDTDPIGTPIGRLLVGASDLDGDVVRLALTKTSGNGTWQYQLSGSGPWLDVGTVTKTAPRLLAAADMLRFRPFGPGTATITYSSYDGTVASVGSKTLALVVNTADQTPLLPKGFTTNLTPITKNTFDAAGDLVSSLFASVYDPDPNAVLGIAITSVSTTSGTWESSSDGVNWSPIGAVSKAAPKRLLGNEYIHFKPSADFTGVVSFSFNVWDASTTNPNGPLAFSSVLGTARLAVNAAPELA